MIHRLNPRGPTFRSGRSAAVPAPKFDTPFLRRLRWVAGHVPEEPALVTISMVLAEVTGSRAASTNYCGLEGPERLRRDLTEIAGAYPQLAHLAYLADYPLPAALLTYATRHDQDLRMPARTLFDPWIAWIGREVARAWKDPWTVVPRGRRWVMSSGVRESALAAALHKIRQNLRGIVDWANATRPDIFRLRFRQAQTRAARWHAALARGAGGGVQRPALPVPAGATVLPLPSGWQLVQLDEEDVGVEGAAMGHCVGGADYQRVLREGQAELWSLRDAEGHPFATIQTTLPVRGRRKLLQAKGPRNALVGVSLALSNRARRRPDPAEGRAILLRGRGVNWTTVGRLREALAALRIGPMSWERHPDSLALVALREKEGG